MSKNILITGATGHLGRAVTSHLVETYPHDQIFALVHDTEKASTLPSGIQIRQGDYHKPDTLITALAGIDIVYFVSSSNFDNRIGQHKNLIDAAKANNVSHIFYTSFERVRESGSPIDMVMHDHLETERYLSASGIPHTILRHGIYMDMLPEFIGPVEQSGVISLPSGSEKVAFTLRSDLAEAASILLTEETLRTGDISLVNTKSWDMTEVASILSQIFNKDIAYIDADPSTFVETLQSYGVPEMYAQITYIFSRAMAEGDLSVTNHELADILGRDPTSLGDFLRQHFQK